MKFWERFFRKKKEITEEQIDPEKLIYTRDMVDFKDEEQRSRYIMNCLEQMSDASREKELLTGEYNLVTSYLMDMEEIEALPEAEKKEVERLASSIVSLHGEKERYKERKSRMSDSTFYKMKAREAEIEEGIEKLKETEKQGALIKQDLVRLDRERQAQAYRKEEMEITCENMRGMALIFIGAMAVGLIVLTLFLLLEYKVMAGYFVLVMAGAIAITVVCVISMDARREALKLSKSINRIIQLQNRVKIRYVNHANLLDYLYLKYDTDSARKLQNRWNCYQKEKEERSKYVQTEEKLEKYRDELVKRLSRYRVRDPYRWVDQASAILDRKEMVEVRHGLILRRQALRKQMEYNNQIAEEANSEILAVTELYPEYAGEIQEMIERYQHV